jgi:hypothetical protein
MAVVLLGQSAQPLQAQVVSEDEIQASPIATELTVTQESISVQEALLGICKANVSIIDAEKCAKHLLGMVMTESEAKATAVGDHGYARGWFQINSLYNPDVSKSCAEDLECSANWTLDRLLKKGYMRSSNWAIWCHNGCGINKYYVPKVLRKGEFHWDKPIALVTAEDIRKLALK